jgi:hypothetical protein
LRQRHGLPKSRGLLRVENWPLAVFKRVADAESPALRHFLKPARPNAKTKPATLGNGSVRPKAGATFLRCHEATALAAVEDNGGGGGNEEVGRIAKRHKTGGDALPPAGSSSVALGAATERSAEASADKEPPPKWQGAIDSDSNVEVVAVGVSGDDVIDLT